MVRLLAFTLATLATPALAEPAVNEPPIEFVTEGDPAPFTGFIFSPARARKLGDGLERCRFKLKMDRDFLTRLMKVETEAAKSTAEIETKAADARAEAAVDALEAFKRDNTREWWDQPGIIFWAGVTAGVAVTAVLGVGSVLTVGYLRPSIPPADAYVAPLSARREDFTTN